MKRPSYTLPNEKFVAYLRVSSAQQGQSGLGLDAQRATVEQFIRRNGQEIIAEFTEIESGKHDNRPQLMKAIEFAKEHDAVLVIAKLDRLSRNVTFISTLQDKDVKFVCCDMPRANELTIGIFAYIAQHERKLISERTKAALDAKKRREPDWKPGTNNFTDEGRQRSQAKIKRLADENIASKHAYHFIKPRRDAGMNWEQIARELNKEGYKTRYGKKFFGVTVQIIYNRFLNINSAVSANATNDKKL